MAGRYRYQTKHARLVVFFVLVCLAAALVRRVTRSPSPPSPRPNWSTYRAPVQPNLNTNLPAPRLNRVQGRWEAVRVSLGLPPLPPEAAFPLELDSASTGRRPAERRASRFGLGKKRREDEAALNRQHPPLLHFDPDTRPS